MKKTVNVLYLCVMITILGLLHTSTSKQCYGEDKVIKDRLLKEYSSPSANGNIIVKHFVDDDGFLGDIWLYSKKDPSKKELLYSYERDANVLISPDEKWLIINNRYGCSDTDAILFKRVKGLKYEAMEDLYIQAWELFERTRKKYKIHVFKGYQRDKIPTYGHSYAEAVRWSSDSKSVLIEIHGRRQETLESLDPWYCIYDVTTGKMTLDLNRVFNRDTYHPNGTAKGR